ncbi:hypothetical protein HPB51_017134 [Rhipicephalus microplus]|uniref:Uncharacterized protein n=1 Tax=Rhipicephalus microplus TaxID=6941 RepID=A0A9J6DWU5_RHIMP|nr:hypothetical protein HPB51_017134 [Rhipicephalus microplus]
MEELERRSRGALLCDDACCSLLLSSFLQYNSGLHTLPPVSQPPPHPGGVPPGPAPPGMPPNRLPPPGELPTYNLLLVATVLAGGESITWVDGTHVELLEELPNCEVILELSESPSTLVPAPNVPPPAPHVNPAFFPQHAGLPPPPTSTQPSDPYGRPPPTQYTHDYRGPTSDSRKQGSLCDL